MATEEVRVLKKIFRRQRRESTSIHYHTSRSVRRDVESQRGRGGCSSGGEGTAAATATSYGCGHGWQPPGQGRGGALARRRGALYVEDSAGKALRMASRRAS